MRWRRPPRLPVLWNVTRDVRIVCAAFVAWVRGPLAQDRPRPSLVRWRDNHGELHSRVTAALMYGNGEVRARSRGISTHTDLIP